jgi:hypothetical protein
MAEITRFGQRLDYDDYPVGGVHQMPDGKWVRYDDHLTALQQQHKQVIAKVEEALLSDAAVRAARNRFERSLGANPDDNARAALFAALATLKGGTDV